MRTRAAARDPHAHAIRAPARRLLHAIPLPFVVKRITGARRLAAPPRLSLVAFLDTLLIAVVFLLSIFAAPQMCMGKRVQVPSAQNAVDILDAPMVTVVGDEVLIDGSLVGSALAIADRGSVSNVRGLHDSLTVKRELWQQLQPGRAFPGVVIFQIDEHAPAIVVKSVFRTAARAGYPNASFMVKKLRDP